MKKGRFAKILSIFIATFFSLFFSILLIEASLHLIKYQPKSIWWQWATWDSPQSKFKLDSKLGWTHKPSTAIWDTGFSTQENNLMIVHTADEYGFRNISKQSNYKKPLVLIVGDSYTYGHNVLNHQTYPHRLQKILHDENIGMDVINAGIQGYGPDQTYIQLKQLIPQFKPDIVIWNFSNNDLSDTLFRPSTFEFNQKIKIVPAWLNGIYLQGLVSRILPKPIIETKTINFIQHHLQNLHVAKFFQKNDEEHALSKISMMVNEIENITPNLLIVANLSHEYLYEPNKNIFTGNLFSSDSHLDINRAILDSPDVYEDEIESLFLNNLEDNSDIEYRHLSPKGNQAVADIVFEYLSQQKTLVK